jgi:hypothetical protein
MASPCQTLIRHLLLSLHLRFAKQEKIVIRTKLSGRNKIPLFPNI